MKVVLLLVMTVFLALSAGEASAQGKVRIKFPAGTHSTTVRGTVRGFAYRDYLVRASEGQTIELKITSTASPSVFVVFLPYMDNLEGAADIDEFTGELPDTGDYVIRVLMMRSEARRKGSVSNYTLTISVR